MTEEIKKDWGKTRETLLDADLLDDDANDETQPGSLESPSYADLEQQLTASEQKAHENWEKSVRAMAEVENIRRRTEREVSNAHRYALEKFATALIPVVDSLEQALQLATQHGDVAMREGIALTTKLMIDVLNKYDVQQIDPVGELFDPQYHEAMSMQPSDSAAPNTVLSVFQKGYVLNDRMIRPARVIVVKG